MLLAIALVPLLFVSAIMFGNYQKSLEASRFSELRHLAAFKAESIEAKFNELKFFTEIIQNAYAVKKYFPVLLQFAYHPIHPESLSARKTLDGIFQKPQAQLGLANIMLTSPEGLVVYASSPQRFSKELPYPLPEFERKAITQAKEKIYFSDVFLKPGSSDAFEMLIAAPVFGFTGSFIGVIVAEVDMAAINRFIADTTGLGKTGELLVGKRAGHQVVYLTPLKHDPGALLTKRIEIGGQTGIPIQKAVQGGQIGSGRALDYRGKDVIAAWRHISSLDWGIVAKIDTQEAFADVINLRNLVISILAMVIVLAGIMAFSIASSISGPIKKLSKGVETIGSGNLDYKVGMNLKDEIGQLSRSFDKMTRDLKNMTTLRDAERRRLYDVLETLPVYVVLLSNDYRVPFANKFFRQRFGESGGRRCFEYLFKRKEPCENCETFKVMETHAPHHWEWLGPDGRNYDIYDFPFTNTDGSPMILEMGIDITVRKKAEAELKTYQENLEALVEERTSELQIILDSVPAMVFYKDKKNRFVRTNRAFEDAMGLPKNKLEGQSIFDLYPKEQAEAYWKDDLEVIDTGKAKRGIVEPMDSSQGTKILQTDKIPSFDEKGLVSGIIGFSVDITESRRAEKERETTIEFLRLVNESTRTRELIQAAITFFQRESGCEAVGIRLSHGGDYPYYETRGFSKEFLSTENLISTRDSVGRPVYNSQGDSLMECLCGNVTQGQVDPTKPFFTQRGSFWTNSTSELFAAEGVADQQACLRNRCHSAGYESVALIALRFADERLGLVQLNDRRKNLFSPETIEAWERLADYLGVAIAKFRAEEELRESQEDLNRAQVVAQLGSWRLNILTNDLRWSGENYRIFGIPKGTPLTYETFLSAVHPDDRKYVDAKWKAGLEGEPYDIEHRIVVDGSVKWVREKAYLEFDPKRKVVGGFGITQDITERKHAEDALRQSEEHFRALSEALPQLVWTAKADGSIDWLNKRWYEYTGRMPEQSQGWAWRDAAHPDDLALTIEKWKEALRTGAVFESEFRVRRHDGEYHWFLVRAWPLRDSQSSVVRWFGSNTDIHNIKQAEEDLLRVNQNLEQFAYVASHDLQEPLRIMASYSQLLEKRYKNRLDKNADDFIGFIVDAAKRMQRLITDLLAYSRAGKFDDEKHESDCDMIISRVIQDLKPGVEESKAVVTHDSLPVVAGPETAYTQLFQNLIANAIKFRRDTPPRIHVGVKNQGAFWAFSVSDNGIGIDEKHQDRIFLIFQRLHGRDKYEGTGIGLSICKKIVENLGGRIWVESEVGKGATFYFTVPRRDSQSS